MGMLTHYSLVELEQKKKGAEKSVPESINKAEEVKETKSTEKQTKRSRK